MDKWLYEKFSDWFHGGTIYFYSDPHFSDEEMKYLRKDYIGDEEQIKRINSRVGKKDTLVILGDVGDKEWVRKLKGYKVLVMGNHDAGATTYKPYFDEVYEGALFISPKIVLTHEPIEYPYALNIHGHDHSHWECQDDLHWNMCAEHIGYTPISIQEIIKSGRLKNIPDIHRATVDRATERKEKRNGKDLADFRSPLEP